MQMPILHRCSARLPGNLFTSSLTRGGGVRRVGRLAGSLGVLRRRFLGPGRAHALLGREHQAEAGRPERRLQLGPGRGAGGRARGRVRRIGRPPAGELVVAAQGVLSRGGSSPPFF